MCLVIIVYRDRSHRIHTSILRRLSWNRLRRLLIFHLSWWCLRFNRRIRFLILLRFDRFLPFNWFLILIRVWLLLLFLFLGRLVLNFLRFWFWRLFLRRLLFLFNRLWFLLLSLGFFNGLVLFFLFGPFRRHLWFFDLLCKDNRCLTYDEQICN